MSMADLSVLNIDKFGENTYQSTKQLMPLVVQRESSIFLKSVMTSLFLLFLDIFYVLMLNLFRQTLQHPLMF